jgi:1,4-alpha-glucan branching enzyme
MAKAKAKTTTKTGRRRIEFQYEDSKAKQVFLVGDFNQWNQKSHPMKKSEDGMWKRSMIIPPGRYEYKFLADGFWKEDNRNQNRCSNEFGTYNCVLDVN